MGLTEFLAAALEAVGGRERVLAVTSYRAAVRREPGGADVAVVRAPGGRIRIDERSAGGRVTVVVRGDAGIRVRDGVAEPLAPADIAEIRRDARLAPRNLLAHAAEYDLRLGPPAVGGRVAVEFPAEGARYLFDAGSLLCAALEDPARGRVTEYGDYRRVAGLTAPFLERVTVAGLSSELRYLEMAFDEDFPADTFAVPGDR